MTLGTDPAVEGKTSLESGLVRVQSPAGSVEVRFEDILEADFGSEPFHLDYFSSWENSGDQLPPGWKAQNITPFDPPGSANYADGTFIVSGGGGTESQTNFNLDKFVFAGLPWTGDGEWTARLKEIDVSDPKKSPAEAGLILREGWNPKALQIWGGPTLGVDSVTGYVGNYHFRRKNGWTQYAMFATRLPIWLRLTRDRDVGVAVGRRPIKRSGS